VQLARGKKPSAQHRALWNPYLEDCRGDTIPSADPDKYCTAPNPHAESSTGRQRFRTNEEVIYVSPVQ
jgi:hypothetical protein